MTRLLVNEVLVSSHKEIPRCRNCFKATVTFVNLEGNLKDMELCPECFVKKINGADVNGF